MAMKRITGLWKKDGKTCAFLSGKITDDIQLRPGDVLFVFPNDNRERDSQPTHTLSLAVDDEKESGSSGF